MHCSATSDMTQDYIITEIAGRARQNSKEAVQLEKKEGVYGSHDIVFFFFFLISRPEVRQGNPLSPVMFLILVSSKPPLGIDTV